MVEGGEATEAATEVEVTFDDMTVLSEGGVDVFVLNWNHSEDPPPFYVDVAELRFAFSASTLLVTGHKALLADYVREQQAEGRIPLFVEREGRYYVYLHDPHAGDDEGDGEAEGEEAD
jgi:hypothetical protein